MVTADRLGFYPLIAAWAQFFDDGEYLKKAADQEMNTDGQPQ